MTRREALAGGAVALGAGMLWGPSAFAASGGQTSWARTVVSATTNSVAVLGAFPTGPVGQAVLVTSWDDFATQFGSPGGGFGSEPSMAVYAVWQLFQNGGDRAWIVRLDAPGAGGSWTPDGFTTAVLAQLGAPASAPTPALDQIAPHVFNIMCIPDLVYLSTATQGSVIATAEGFCRERQAFLIVDPPPPAAAMPGAWLPGAEATPVDAVGTSGGMASLEAWADPILGAQHTAAAAYYPWVRIADPWSDNASRWVPPSGTVAGVYAATDTATGVWKAPAGVKATLQGVTALADTSVNDDAVSGPLNVQGINCVRTLPTYGNVIWGARTLAGGTVSASAFKYVSVRRLADFVEQSLQQSMTWARFEPNDAQLWSSLRQEATAFLAGLYTSGAFVGATASQAYEVTCDASTTSAEDQQNGVVNLSVQFAPTDPAEFVELTITLATG
jgi:hypothetical protein